MVSLVLQMGDCNAPATYQALMNYIFSPYLNRFLDVYLDDIIIYSDTLKDHIEQCKIAMDVLKKEKLYLSKKKINFLPNKMKLLGRIIDETGICMDPEKVDSILAWKTPTNRDLLRGFIGSVGFLADDLPSIRIPLGILSKITGDRVPFRWGFNEQRAFEDVKKITHEMRKHSCHPISYEKMADPVWMVTDGCLTGIAGVISQGKDWKSGNMSAFYSAKLNLAQRNYPVHEIEMLASVETMLRHRDILQGVHFKWITDHKGLIYLLNQKNISGCQSRWLEKISSFIFEVIYVPGTENVLADALSRIYSNNSSGTERTNTEYTYYDIIDDDITINTTGMLLLSGIEAIVATRRVRKPSRKAIEGKEPESSKEFVKRLKNKFVLRGPRERTEGESIGPVPKLEVPELEEPELENEGPEQGKNLDGNQNIDKNTSDTEEVEEVNTSETSNDSDVTSLLLQSDGIDLFKELRGRYSEDTIFKAVIERPKEFKNFEVKEDLIYIKINGRHLLCIPKILIKGRSVYELIISEAHSMLAHLGARKTIQYLRNYVW